LITLKTNHDNANGFLMQKAVGELFISKCTKPLPIIFNFWHLTSKYSN